MAGLVAVDHYFGNTIQSVWEIVQGDRTKEITCCND